MNNDYVEKNLVYQDQVQQIAKLVFHAFYYDEEEKLNYSPSEDYEKEVIDELLPMAEKIFHFFGTAEEAKKAIRFLHTVNPIKAKEIFDEL
jgi:hypothetical protein